MLFTPAPNAITFIVGPKWGNSPTLFDQPKQWEIVRDFFSLRCACAKGDGKITPKTTRAFLEVEAADYLTWSTAYGEDVCPKCHSTRSELVEREALRAYNRGLLVIGQRAGKTTIGAEIARVIEHYVLCIAHSAPGGLQGHLGLPRTAMFDALFLAAERVQAAKTIWAAYCALRHESPWFGRYTAWVKEEEARQIRAPGVLPWAYTETGRAISNEHPHVRLSILSGSTNSPAQRGATRLYGFIDEISHMLQTDSVRSARENYRVMRNQLLTARSRVRLCGAWPWLGVLWALTSPASREDKGMELLGEAEIDPGLYTMHEATWDFNPMEPYENFELLMRTDPVGTMRDFGAQPPGAEYPLIHDALRFRALSIDDTLRPLMTFRTRTFDDATGHAYVAPEVEAVGWSRSDAPRFLAFDAGLTHDAFTGTCMYGEPIVDDNGKPVGVEVFQDWIFRVVPEAGQEVWFEAILAIVEQTVNMVHVGAIAFDHWQSHQLVQQCRARFSVFAEEETTPDGDYEALRTDGLSGRLHLLPPAPDDFDERGNRRKDPRLLSPAGAAIYELLGLQQDPTTRKVSNPRKGQARGANSDDAARVVVHGRRMVARAGYVERQDDRSARARRQRLLGNTSEWSERGAVVSAHGSSRWMGGTGRGLPAGGLGGPGGLGAGGSSGGQFGGSGFGGGSGGAGGWRPGGSR